MRVRYKFATLSMWVEASRGDRLELLEASKNFKRTTEGEP